MLKWNINNRTKKAAIRNRNSELETLKQNVEIRENDLTVKLYNSTYFPDLEILHL